ncbi:MAG: cysteine methyltransferase [Jatrophihabitantaceae bacterium]|nr:cysteine methyltransferase [Jatrophihabitantaceae bacterium]
MRTHLTVDSPIGALTLVNADGVLAGLYMHEQRHRPGPEMLGDRADAGFASALEQLEEYFAGERTIFDLPLAPVGTPFQQRVWDQLRQIPYGQTWTYAAIAARIDGGRTNAVRAVGAANGRNPISVIVPCHRVVGSDGSLTGYAGGVERKEFLLSLENPARVSAGTLF